MNGVHDMGGMHGFGPVVAEPNEPAFHADWERRVLALNLAMGAWRRWNIDMGRYTIEQMPPLAYLAASYYERWLWRLEQLLVDKDLVHPDELGQSRAATPVPLQDGALRREGVEPMLRRRRAARLDDPVAPCFHVGDAVRARNINPVGHTRLPRYTRGRLGRIVRDHGVFIFPDTHAAGEGTKPQHVYSVRFSAEELWGPQASPRDSVYVDLWDDYLESA